MKRTTALPFWLAAAALVMACPQISNAQDMNNSVPSTPGQVMQMVPAQAALASNLDARKMQLGTKFDAILSQTVHLKDGTELPRGTRLIGAVTSDSTAPQGKASLALRFTQADLKDGKTLPIKATIIDVIPDQSRYADNPNNQSVPIPWDGREAKIDEIGAVSGVDLHSNIDGNISGVFVATKKDDVKLRAGSELSLAIGMQG